MDAKPLPLTSKCHGTKISRAGEPWPQFDGPGRHREVAWHSPLRPGPPLFLGFLPAYCLVADPGASLPVSPIRAMRVASSVASDYQGPPKFRENSTGIVPVPGRSRLV